MRILDRERYWAFVKAYFICYFSLVGLYIVIDAFSNFDEFTKRADGLDLVRVMGRYYLIRQSQMFDQLSGVIGMMAAIFTVTWMQRNNEHLAMLAASCWWNRRRISCFLVRLSREALGRSAFRSMVVGCGPTRSRKPWPRSRGLASSSGSR